jgi:hypothetical protein
MRSRVRSASSRSEDDSWAAAISVRSFFSVHQAKGVAVLPFFDGGGERPGERIHGLGLQLVQASGVDCFPPEIVNGGHGLQEGSGCDLRAHLLHARLRQRNRTG